MVVTRNCYGLMAINKSSFLFIGLFENGGRRNGLEVGTSRAHGTQSRGKKRATTGEGYRGVMPGFWCFFLSYTSNIPRLQIQGPHGEIETTDHFKFVFETTLDFHQYIGRSAHSCIYRFYLFIFERCSVSPWAKLEITSNLVLPAIYLSSVCLSFFFSLIHKYTHTPRYKPEEFLIVHVHGSSPV